MKYSQVKLRLSSHLQGKVHYSLDVGDDTSRGTRHERGGKNFWTRRQGRAKTLGIFLRRAKSFRLD